MLAAGETARGVGHEGSLHATREHQRLERAGRQRRSS